MMRLGFIGTGTITAAIVRGLGARFGDDGLMIVVSPRSAGTSAALAGEFAHVRVAADNQDVLDSSDVVMLAVRPQVARAVIAPLRFRTDHHVISLIATLPLEAVNALVAPATTASKAVPLPAVALGRGATAIYPPDPIAAALFGHTGTTIEVQRAAMFDALTAVSATMASYFAFADAIASWLAEHDVPVADARRYVSAVFDGLAATTATQAEADFPTLAVEHATVGGINEQLVGQLRDRGMFTAVGTGLDAILARIQAAPDR